MSNETYNGYTNFATWKVNLEYFDGWLENKEDEEIKEIAALTTLAERNKYVDTEGIDKKWHDDATDAIEFCDSLKEEVEEAIDSIDTDRGYIADLAKGWALTFLNEVNWVEIADSIITNARDRLKGEA